MLTYIGIGGGLAFAAAVQPGPLQAYFLSRVTAIGWRRTLPAALAPLLSDGPIALLALLVLGRLSPAQQAGLGVAGGVLLLVLAIRAFRQWLAPDRGASGDQENPPRTLFEAALVNLLNPNPYLGWTLILGPVVMAAWREAPIGGIAVVASFYTVMVAVMAASIIAFGTATLLGPRFQRGLLLLSAIILVGLACYQLITHGGHFLGA